MTDGQRAADPSTPAARMRSNARLIFWMSIACGSVGAFIVAVIKASDPLAATIVWLLGTGFCAALARNLYYQWARRQDTTSGSVPPLVGGTGLRSIRLAASAASALVALVGIGFLAVAGEPLIGVIVVGLAMLNLLTWLLVWRRARTQLEQAGWRW